MWRHIHELSWEPYGNLVPRVLSLLSRSRERTLGTRLPSIMGDFVTPHVMHLMSISFFNFKILHWKCFGTKRKANFLPKALTKERTKRSSNIRPKLPSLGRESWAGRWTQHSPGTLQTTIRNNTSIKYDLKQVCKSSFKRLDVIKIEKGRARETPDSSDVQHSLKELRKVF